MGNGALAGLGRRCWGRCAMVAPLPGSYRTEAPQGTPPSYQSIALRTIHFVMPKEYSVAKVRIPIVCAICLFVNTNS